MGLSFILLFISASFLVEAFPPTDIRGVESNTIQLFDGTINIFLTDDDRDLIRSLCNEIQNFLEATKTYLDPDFPRTVEVDYGLSIVEAFGNSLSDGIENVELLRKLLPTSTNVDIKFWLLETEQEPIPEPTTAEPEQESTTPEQEPTTPEPEPEPEPTTAGKSS